MSHNIIKTFTPYTLGSGNCRRTNVESFASARGGATANEVTNSGGVEVMVQAEAGVGENWFYRGLAQFDISDLPAGLIVKSAILTLSFSVQDDNDNGALCVAESTQPAETTLAASHYNDVTLSPTEFAPRITFNGASATETFTFDATGIARIEALASTNSTWLKLSFRERKDVDNDSSSAKNRVIVNLDSISLAVTYVTGGLAFII